MALVPPAQAEGQRACAYQQPFLEIVEVHVARVEDQVLLVPAGRDERACFIWVALREVDCEL